jgi:hypothetical protein
MTEYSLRPYFHLLHRPGESRSVADMRADLGHHAFDALCDSGWLDVAPANEALHPAPAGVVGDGHRDLGGVADGPRDIILACMPNERVLLETASNWLQLRPTIPDRVNIGSEIVLVGWMERPDPRPVFFARRVAHLETVRQLDELEKRGAAVVLTTTAEPNLPSFIVARFSGQSQVRLLALEEFAEVRHARALLRAAPADVLRPLTKVREAPAHECDLITLDGRRRIGGVELEAIRRASGDFDLFADFTVPAVDAPGQYGGSARHGSTHWTFSLTNMEGAIFREFVSAPMQLLWPERLRCRRTLQMRTPVEKFCDMRRKADVRYARNCYRAFHGYKNALGRSDHFSFQPPAGFQLAVLDHFAR